jgi:hypothetical protein
MPSRCSFERAMTITRMTTESSGSTPRRRAANAEPCKFRPRVGHGAKVTLRRWWRPERMRRSVRVWQAAPDVRRQADGVTPTALPQRVPVVLGSRNKVETSTCYHLEADSDG